MSAQKQIFIVTFVVAFSLMFLSTARAQLFQQGNKLVGTGAVGYAHQGGSVALSADGNTAIIGGWGDNNDSGAAWVFTRSGSVWTQQGSKLIGTRGVGQSGQGTSVALSSDGNTAIVSGASDTGGIGAVWIFTRSGGAWTQQGSKLVGTGGAGQSGQGWSVALSADGNTAIVGGAADSSIIGAVWVFKRSAGVWSQQGDKLVATDGVGQPGLGNSVSVSADGNTAIIGGNNDNHGIGAAWIFTRTGNVWGQQGSKLVGTGAAGRAFQGTSVSLSADGNTAIIGGTGDTSNLGAAWVFTRTNGVWTQQGSKLVGKGAVGSAGQGTSVSVSADGNTALVSGPHDNGGILTGTGATWEFVRRGDEWIQLGNKLVGTGAVGYAWQGSSVSLSADGNTALIGGDADSSRAGAVWVYSRGILVIDSISDIPHDQGGWVRVTWNGFILDNTGESPQVTSYGIWRKIPTGISLSAYKRSVPPHDLSLDGDSVLSQYDYLMSVPAVQIPSYHVVVPTLADSSASGIPYFTYVITAFTADINIYYVSNPDSGYSVDNIPPLAPRNLDLSVHSDSVVLHWNSNSEPDLGRYAVYRSTGSITDLFSMQPYAYSRDTIFVDTAHMQSVYYVVRAEDIHDNLSPPSNQVSEKSNGIPTSYVLYQNYPNPFNPTTTLTYALPTESKVTLKIYNVLGQLVATLVNNEVNAGYQSAQWNASNVASGIYFYRIEATSIANPNKTFAQVKKMVLMK